MLLVIIFILSCTTVNVFAVEFIWSSNGATTDIFEMNAEAFLKLLTHEIQQQNQKIEEKLLIERKLLLADFETMQRKINQEFQHRMQQNILTMFEDLKRGTHRHNENQQSDIKSLREEMKNMSNMLLKELKSDETKSQHESIKNEIFKLKTNQQNSIDLLRNDIQKEHNKIQNINEEIKKNAIKNFDGNYPSTCAQALYGGGTSGVYTIKVPILNTPPFAVYCEVDPEGGAAWTIFQRRMDGTVDFYRNWTEYQNGFGNADGEYFIGLDRLHRMTNATKMELWIKMGDFENQTRKAKYSSFAVGNELESYNLHDVGQYSGDAGDSFSQHKGQPFTTKDKDNDDSKLQNCATIKHGAWWYKVCHWSNLNGRYLRGNYSSAFDSEGVSWGNWHGYQYSLKYTHMAIRPIKL